MEELKMLTQEEVANILNVHVHTVTMLRETGVIKAIKTGKCYMFSKDSIKAFQQNYVGLDVSNREKAIESYKVVNSIN